MVLGLFLILIVLIIIPYSFEFIYHRQRDDDQLKIILWIWRIPLKIRISYIDWVGNLWVSITELGPDRQNLDFEHKLNLDRIVQLIIQPIPKYIRTIMVKVSFLFREIEKLDVRVKYSTGDAALTGIIGGLSWAFIGNVLGIIDSFCVIQEKPIVKIIPSYGAPLLDLRLHCIFQIRLGHIISKMIRRKMGKGGYKFGNKSSN